MNCRRIEELINLTADGRASEAQQRAVENHTSACSGCAELMRHTRELSRMLVTLPERPVSEEWDGRLATRLASVTPSAPAGAFWQRFSFHYGWRLPVPALATAGAVAVAIAAGVLLQPVAPRPNGASGSQGYLSAAVERHKMLERSNGETDWEAVNASIDLNTADVFTE